MTDGNIIKYFNTIHKLGKPGPGRIKGSSVTIKKLAAILGLSHSTVSRALNGHPAISQSTRESVLQAAKKYGYIPNSAAQALRNATSGAFGVIIPDIQNDFFISVTNAIAREAGKRSWQMILAITEDHPDTEYHVLRRMMAASVDGIIIAPSANPLPETRELITRTHAVQLLRRHDGIQAPLIAIDDRYGISLATVHLRRLGHTRIGYIGSSTDLSTGFERLQGFLQHFSSAEQAALKDIIHIGPPQAEFGTAAFKRIMSVDHAPSALVLGSPRYAMGMLTAAKALRVRIPQDLSVVAYGLVPWGSLLDMQLTTVVLPEKEVTDACVDMIRHIMDSELTLTHDEFIRSTENQLFTPRLALGDSTGVNRSER
ncbi:LacI family DNA-binding transcriptional regulator [Acerihabitans sp.]|uniref:LacI family DNA-binding transcriptional regulator n=1 Tax=Acerihabitans sp. TaxID=2811394 RepID=UPI002ED95423